MFRSKVDIKGEKNPKLYGLFFEAFPFFFTPFNVAYTICFSLFTPQLNLKSLPKKKITIMIIILIPKIFLKYFVY